MTKVNKPKRKYSLQEKLAVVKGVLSGHDWKDIIDKNTEIEDINGYILCFGKAL